jgi:hypothetical protein
MTSQEQAIAIDSDYEKQSRIKGNPSERMDDIVGTVNKKEFYFFRQRIIGLACETFAKFNLAIPP